MQAFAARGCFGAGDVTGLPVSSPAEALDTVVQGRADYACVAIENSVDGAVTPTFDALAAAEGVQIYHEFALDISFAFMRGDAALTSAPPRLSTHPVAWQQVKLSAQRLLGEVEFIPASSNAAAAEAVARGEADYAAAPEAAADVVADGFVGPLSLAVGHSGMITVTQAFAGAVTWKVALAVSPGLRVFAAGAAETFQSFGTSRASVTPVMSLPVVLVSFTVTGAACPAPMS